MNRKNRKLFRPCKIPRYLIGSVSPNIWKTDLAEFNTHRFKVFSAKPRVDTKPPKMNPFNYINMRKMRDDAQRLKIIDKENKELLKAINAINRTIGRVDSYNPQAYAVQSKWKSHVVHMKKIEQKNKTIYRKIIMASSSYQRATLEKHWLGMIEKLRLSARFPLVILQKCTADMRLSSQPSVSAGLDKSSERPLCFLEFKVVDGPNLGRVVIELYHDHVPVTVQNFLAICSGNNKKDLSFKNSNIYRIVPGKFLEAGDITKGTGKGGMSIYGKYFTEEGHKLKHTKAGVLSMVRIHQHSNNSRFCITFASMETLDKQNVVFGRIIKGADNLFKIEGYGRKVGKPLTSIIISNCGNLNRPPEM